MTVGCVKSSMIFGPLHYRPMLCCLSRVAVTFMLERCSYVRCLMIDFSKAFDLVDHPILLGTLASLGLPDRAIDWIISYLTGRTQVVKCGDSVSSTAEINTSIIQGSGIGPML